MLRKREAFTLLEMSIVLFIISLLILIVLPNLTAQRKSAKRIHRDAMVSVVQTQVDEYANDGGNECQPRRVERCQILDGCPSKESS